MRHRFLPTLTFTLLLLLIVLAPTASAQVVCGDHILGCVGPGTTGPRECWSNAAAVGILTGTPCAAPQGSRNASEVCRGTGVQANQACCGCVTGALSCAPMLPNSSTLEIFAQSDLGLSSIAPVDVVNANLTTYGFSPGTTSPIQILATKIDTSQWARVELQVCDSGTCLTCDPLITHVMIRPTGKPVSGRFGNLPEAESKVTISNGSPGLRNLIVRVNGEIFRLNNLRDGETRTIDAASAMLPDATNIIALTSRGKPGAQATVMIHD